MNNKISINSLRSNLYFNLQTFSKCVSALVVTFIIFAFCLFGIHLTPFLSQTRLFDKNEFINNQNDIYLNIAIGTSVFLFMFAIFSLPSFTISLRRRGIYERMGTMRKDWKTFSILNFISYWIILIMTGIVYMLIPTFIWIAVLGKGMNYLDLLIFLIKEVAFIIMISIFYSSLAILLSNIFNGNWFTLIISFVAFQILALLSMYFYYGYQGDFFSFLTNDPNSLMALDYIFYTINPCLLSIRTLSVQSIVFDWRELVLMLILIIGYSSLIMFITIKYFKY